MACDCLTNVGEKLAPEHKLEVAIVLSGCTLVARPYSRILRKDNGRPETRRGKHTAFIFTYCPFCGARYEVEPATPSPRAEAKA